MDHPRPIPLRDLELVYPVLPRQLLLLPAPVLANPRDVAFLLHSVAQRLVLEGHLRLVDLEASHRVVSLVALPYSLGVVDHLEGPVSLVVLFMLVKMADFF